MRGRGISRMGNAQLLWSSRTGRERFCSGHTHTHARNFRFTAASARASNVTKRIEGLRAKGGWEAWNRLKERFETGRDGGCGGIQTDEGGGERERETEKRRQENSLPGNVWYTFSVRSSLYRLLCGSKAEAKSPIHKGGWRQEGECSTICKVFSRATGRKAFLGWQIRAERTPANRIESSRKIRANEKSRGWDLRFSFFFFLFFLCIYIYSRLTDFEETVPRWLMFSHLWRN